MEPKGSFTQNKKGSEREFFYVNIKLDSLLSQLDKRRFRSDINEP